MSSPGTMALGNWPLDFLVAFAIGVYIMPSSHRTAVAILCVHVSFLVYGLESDTVRYITVVKDVSYVARNWPRFKK